MRTRLVRRALLAVLLGFGITWFGAPDVQASALADLSTEQLTDGATWIVRGTVVDVWTEMDGNDYVWTRARLRVSHVLKGDGQPDELIVDSLGGTYHDVTMQVLQTPRWSVGEQVLVFLDEVAGGRLSPLGLYLGKYTIRRAPHQTRHHVLRWHGKPGEPYDHRFLPHPPEYRRVYLDDLVESVEARLDVGWDGEPIPGLSTERLHRVNTLETRRRR